MRQCITLVFLTITLFQGCKVTHEFTGVEHNLEIDQFRMTVSTMDSTSMGEMSVDEFFQSPKLVHLIQTGLNNNYDLGMALKTIQIAQAYYMQGKAAYFPTLSAGSQVSYGVRSEHSGLGAVSGDRLYQSYQLGVNAAWEADIWGKLKSQEKAAFADFLAANAGLKAVQTELIAQIASLYYQLVALDARREITKRTIENWRTSVQTIESLKEAGTVTEVAVQQNKAQLHFAEATLIDIEQSIFLLENTMNTLLARPYQSVDREQWEDIQLPEFLEAGLPVQLMSNRADLQQIEHQVRSDFEGINIARTYFYPSLRITAGGGIESIRAGDFFNPGSLFANIAGGLTQPIFDRRQNKTQLEVAIIQYEQTLIRYEQTFLQAVQEVTDALFMAQKAEEKMAFQHSQLNVLDKAVNFSGELLNNGMANYLEVLRARDQVFSTELGLVDTRLRKISAVVSLYKALGGGWNPDSLKALQAIKD